MSRDFQTDENEEKQNREYLRKLDKDSFQRLQQQVVDEISNRGFPAPGEMQGKQYQAWSENLIRQGDAERRRKDEEVRKANMIAQRKQRYGG